MKLKLNLHERIINHSGMPYFRAILNYTHSKNILSGNAFELKRFIQALENHEIEQKLGLEEFRGRFSDFDGHLVRYLHNFLAGVMTFVSHTRVLMRSQIIRPSHRDRYQNKIKEMFRDVPLAQFIQDFRNYVLHYGVPVTIHRTRLMPKEHTEVLISMEQMQHWDGWTQKSRGFIQLHLPTMRLYLLAETYEALALKFHEWFAHDFVTEYSKELNELNSLQEQWNQGLKG